MSTILLAREMAICAGRLNLRESSLPDLLSSCVISQENNGLRYTKI
jgi:hypothetical protein